MFESLFSNGSLSLDRLRSFLEVAEAGGIAKAAPGDVVRQSQISRQVRELAEFFGTELTQRRGKSIVITASGRRLADLVRAQLRGLDDFRREEAGRAKTFVIGAGASTLQWLVTPRLPALAALLGGAQLRTETARSRALVEAVREGRIDFAVVRKDAIPDRSKEYCHAVADLSFHLCVPRRLLARGTTEEDLSEVSRWGSLPFAAGRDGGQLDKAIRKAMADAGVDFRPRFECGSMLQVRQLLEAESCAAILPSLALAGFDPRRLLVAPFRPLEGHGRKLVLHWSPRHSAIRGVADDVIGSCADALAG